MRYFSSIFEVVRAKKTKLLEESRKINLSKPNVPIILKRYEAIEPIHSNITKNEFVKKISNLRSLTMDALSHLPYYKCEDISAIIKFLSRIKYRDIILLQGLCEALYWQCSLNKARLRSITTVLSNLANLYYVPKLRITRTLFDQLDNPKNRQSIGDYTRLYKFLVFNNLMDSNHFVESYQRIEQKCLSSLGLMNHSQLALISTILLHLPGGKWELMDRICVNFQRKIHEIPIDSFVKLLKNINRLKSEFKLAPRSCPLLISQIVNTRELDNMAILTILQTMSTYYIRDPPILSKLGRLISESGGYTLDQYILMLNMFSQLNYKHKEFLSSIPLKTISEGIKKLKLIVNCKTIEDVKELFQDFYQYLAIPRTKFIHFSIAYINCLAKVDYNKREFVFDALEIIKQCNLCRADFALLRNTPLLFPTKSIQFGVIRPPNYTQVSGNGFVKTLDFTSGDIIERYLNKPDPLVKPRELSRFSYSKTGLLRTDSSVLNYLRDLSIKQYKPIELIISKPKTSPFDSIEEFRSKRVVDRGGIQLPIDCKVYRTKTFSELYTSFWKRTYGDLLHPAYKRLQNKRVFKTLIKILFKKRSNDKTPKHYQKSRLYGSEIMLETSSGVTDKDEIRRLYLKRRRYAGFRRFESNLTYVNKWRLLRRCFLRPYSKLFEAFHIRSSDPYFASIVDLYRDSRLSGFSFDSFITNGKNPIIYDTDYILNPCIDYVRMGKTIREFKRIRDRYYDKWRDSVSEVIRLNENIIRISKSDLNNKYLNLLVGGLESLNKLNCRDLKYLFYVIREIKRADGDPIDQLYLGNRLHRAILNYKSEILEANRGVLVELYGKYIPMIGEVECKVPGEIDRFMYTIGNSLEVIESIGALNEMKIDYKKLGIQFIKMKDELDNIKGRSFTSYFVKLENFLSKGLSEG